MRKVNQIDNVLKLLHQYTKTPWCTIPTHKIQPKQCLIHWQKTPISHTKPVYLTPKHAPPIYHPKKLLSYFNSPAQNALSLLPAIKYDLNNTSITLMDEDVYTPTGIWRLSGTMGLIGNIIIKAIHRKNNITISVNTIKQINMNAQIAKDQFIRTLKVKASMKDGAPIISLGSSISDKINMTSVSSNVQLDPVSNAITFKASCNPSMPIRIPNRALGVILEIQLGYCFTGKGQFQPTDMTTVNSQANLAQISQSGHHTGEILIGGGIMLGAILLTIFTGGTDLLVAGGVTAALASPST